MRICSLAVALCLIAANVSPAQVPADGTLPPDLPAAAQTAYKQGVDFEQRGQFDSALDSFRSAGKQAGSSLACLEAAERVQLKMEKYKDAAATASAMATVAPDPQAKAHAGMLEGQALYREYFAYNLGEGAYEKNPKRASEALRQAEAALARGAAADPANEPVRMLHGRVLAALKRDEEASREFAACAAAPGASPAECARALRLSHNVASAREEPVPSFQVATLDGKTVSLDSLAGKVVLVDFWATWCTFCRRDSDYVQSMLDSFPDGRFVLLEVDVDENRDLWVDYVKENRLEGLQTRDAAKDMQSTLR